MPSQYHPTVSVLGHLPVAPVMDKERERERRGRPPLSTTSSSSLTTASSTSSSPASPHAPAAQSLMQKVFGSRSTRHSHDTVPLAKDARKSAKSPIARDRSRREEIKESPTGEAAAESSKQSPGPSALPTMEIMRRLKQGQKDGGTVEEKVDAARERVSLLGDLAHRVTMSLSDAMVQPLQIFAVEKGKEKETPTVDTSIPSFEDLLDVTLPHCSPYSAQPIREVGFALLGATLCLPTVVDSLGLTRTSNLFKLCLADPSASTLNPTKSETSWNASPALETIYRVGCLERLTKHGEDFSFGLECGLVANLVQWIRSAGKDWVTWCGSAETLDVGFEDDVEHALLPTLEGGHADGKRESRTSWDASAMPAGLALTGMKDQPEGLGSAVKVDKESPARPIPQRSVTHDAPPISPASCLKILCSFLLAILKHNLPFFSPEDLASIITIHAEILASGVKATPRTRVIASQIKPTHKLSRTASQVSSDKQALAEVRVRSESISRTTLVKAPVAPPVRDHASQLSEATLSRSSSILKRTVDLVSNKAAPASPVTSNIGQPEDGIKRRDHAAEPSSGSFSSMMQTRTVLVLSPRFATLLPDFLELLRFLLEQNILSPQVLAVVIPLLCTCFSFRADADTPNISCHLEGKDRTGVAGLVEDMLGHPLIGRTTDRSLRRILESGNEKAPARTAGVLAGALMITRDILQRSYATSRIKSPGGSVKPKLRDFTFPTLTRSLAACLKAASRTDASVSTERDVDVLVLDLVSDYLSSTDMSDDDADKESAMIGSTWQAVAEVVEAGRDAFCKYNLDNGSPLRLRQTAIVPSADLPPAVAAYSRVLHQLLPADAAGTGRPLHAKLAQFLLKMPQQLDAPLAMRIIDSYRLHGSCMPAVPEWIDNIWDILKAFYLPGFVTESFGAMVESDENVREHAGNLLFEHVWDYVKEYPESRVELVDRVLLQLAEQSLWQESNEQLTKSFLETLIGSAVAETVEKDALRRAVRSNGGTPVEESDEDQGHFERIRQLILKIATQSACTVAKSDSRTRSTSRHGHLDSIDGSPTTEEERRLEETAQPQAREATGLLSIVGSFSPTFGKPKDLPNIAGVTNSLAVHPPADVTSGKDNPPRPPSVPAEVSTPTPHSDCRSLAAVTAIISIFTRLAFLTPHTLISASTRISRLPASSRCITLFKDMMLLLSPIVGQRGSERTSILHAECPRARLALLQWLMRLRANKQHRIWVKPELDDAAVSSARILGRAGELSAVVASHTAEIENSSRRRVGTGNASEPVREERGRESKLMRESTGRSRSRSRQPAVPSPQPSPSQIPLWSIPDQLGFECPPDSRPSEGMTTYDPATNPGDDPPEGVWLPISEYIKVIIEILTVEPSWDLVAYTLVFLPLQLANKHFFCGPRASSGVRQLRRVVCEVLQQGRIVGNAELPSVVRRTDNRAVAYQTLTILISYKKLFTKQDGDGMVEAFAKGLREHYNTAKPCIQALTIATYELDQSLAKHLPTILPELSQIMSNPAMSIHIMEMLAAIGQVPALYSSFTDEHYRLIFKVALAYIQLHIDAKSPITLRQGSKLTEAECEAATLAGHVIGLSYFTIYTWFLAVRLPSRPKFIPDLTHQLLLAHADKSQLDEMTEVCFDWLGRYAYGNADPKPASSFINDLVMDNGARRPADEAEHNDNKAVSRSWLLGGGVVTITAKPRTGWVTITTRRPSGTVSMLCKLENVPMLGVGEDDADLRVLPALMQSDRDFEEMAKPPLGSLPVIESGSTEMPSPIEVPGETQVASGAELPLQASTSGSSRRTERVDTSQDYIWSGQTPSQRRKDVAIHPSFIGLQLSAYPYANMNSPRGRQLPEGDQLDALLRQLDGVQVIDHHRIAVLYVGPGQTTEREILANDNGSPAFLKLLAGMGRLVRLRDQKDVYTGGLDKFSDEDGEFAYAWWDDLTQIAYLAPHMMPSKKHDPNHNDKKAHVGNAYVRVVYNDSGADYRFDTISTQFQYINIVISAHTAGVTGTYNDKDEHDFFKVTLQRAPGIPDFSPIGDFKLISAATLPLVIRQISLMADHITQVFVQADHGVEYVSNWRRRYQMLQRYKASLPEIPVPDGNTEQFQIQVLLRDFTKTF